MARAWASATAAHPCFCVRTHVGVGAHHGTAQVRDELIRLRPLRDLLRRLLGLQGGSSRTQREGEGSIRVGPPCRIATASGAAYRSTPVLVPAGAAAQPQSSCSPQLLPRLLPRQRKRKEARRVREQPRARNSTTREHASEKKVPLV